jgi:foldase protein PrsA
MIDTYVLEESFPSNIKEGKDNVESYYKAAVENYKGEDKLLSALQQSGIASIDAYKEMIYLNFLQSKAAEAYAKEQITDKEVEKYYKDKVVGDIEVSHILITPDVTDDMKEEDIKKAENKAKEAIEKIIKDLEKNKKEDLKATFEKLAKEKSEDAATKDKGGSLGKINKDTLSPEYAALVDQAYAIKDGEYSVKAIKTELGYHVIYKTKSYEKASLKDSKSKILDTLAQELLAKDATVYVNALTHYRKELGMNIQDKELQKQYSNYVQNQLASITNQQAQQSEGK